METSPRGKIGYDAANNPIMKKKTKNHVTETYTRAYIGGDSNEAHHGDWTDDGRQPNPRGSWRPDGGFTEAETEDEGGVLERPDLVPDWQDAPASQRV